MAATPIYNPIQDDTGDLHGVSQPVISKTCKKIASLLAHISQRYIKMPVTLDEQEESMRKFRSIANFPRVIGAIDCTHIPIKKTRADGGLLYINRKGFPSINVQIIPCVHPIPGGLFPGRMIRFQGSIPPGAQRFAINLQCGPNTDPRDDIALHLNFRFVEMCVVRNHLTAMSWGLEETSGGMPLTRGEAFEALVLCEQHSLKVALNGAHFCEFPHRLPFQRISHLTVDGDVMLQFIGFEGAQPPPSQMYMSEQPNYGTYGAPPPQYGAPGYGAPQGFSSVPVGGYESSQYMAQQQQRRGLGTGAAVGLGVGALAAGGLAGYALGGGFSSDSPTTEEVQVADFSESADFGGDDWMD